MKLTVIGMDIAKHVFQLHAVNPSTGEIERIKLRRSQLLEFLRSGSVRWWRWKLAVARITGPESCCSSDMTSS